MTEPNNTQENAVPTPEPQQPTQQYVPQPTQAYPQQQPTQQYAQPAQQPYQPPMQQQYQQPYSPQYAMPPKPKKPFYKKPWFIAIVIVLLLAMCGRGGSGKKTDEQVTPEVTQEQVQEEATEQEAEPEEAPEPEPEPAPEPEPEPEPEPAPEVDESVIRPEFKEAMDSYEAFFDEYVEVMKAFSSDPTNAELLMRVSDLTAQEADMMAKFDAWEEEDMTDAELAYYLEVQSRIYAKLAEVA